MLLYALHDAMAKGMPGQPQAPCLAESWSVSEDGLTYDFVLRRGTLFHNGEPVTAEDVKFSFERYHGASHGLMKQRVAAVETPDPGHVTFKLKQPWPDFLTFYAGATGAGWIVPKKYVEKIGDEGFRKAPVGAGPYRIRLVRRRCRTGSGGVRPILAQAAECEAFGAEGRAGRGHAARGTQGR